MSRLVLYGAVLVSLITPLLSMAVSLGSSNASLLASVAVTLSTIATSGVLWRVRQVKVQDYAMSTLRPDVDETRTLLLDELSDAPWPVVESTMMRLLQGHGGLSAGANGESKLHRILADETHSRDERILEALIFIETHRSGEEK